MSNIEQYQLFLDRYKAGINDSLKPIIKLVKDYTLLLDERTQDDEIKSFDFSIFNIVKFKRPEENLHSPLIKELLDPNGTHGQKDLFYRLFIKMFLSETQSEKYINSNGLHYFIKREEFIQNETNQGKIDIVIQSINPEKKFAIIIENKWGSGDSCPDQLYKYYINFTKSRGYTDTNLLVFYLTKNGNDPYWIKDDNFQKFLLENKGKNYFPISYRNHIQTWLISCIKYCKSEKVNYILEQYKNHLQWHL